MDPICCDTGYAFLDVWTLVHLAFWIFIGSTLWAVHLHKWVAVIYCLLLAYAWEVLEFVLAPRHPEIWKDPESWWNAWVSDPITCLVGVLVIWTLLDHRNRRP